MQSRLRTCPHCNCILRPERYERHLAARHSPEMLARARKSEEDLKQGRVERDSLVICDICHVQLKVRNLDRHRNRFHHLRPSGQPTERFSQNANQNPESAHFSVEVPCSCGGENERCYRCYGTGFHERQVIDQSLSSVNASVPKLDFSRRTLGLGGFASDSRGDDYSIRENGRFSSFPLFDDLDDESSS